MKKYLPINLDISNRNILIVGGGNIALNKIKLLSKFTSNITVIAPLIKAEIKNIINNIKEKEFETNDLKEFRLVYACTNIRNLNEKIKKDCQDKNILVNVVDNPSLSDFISPAIYKEHEMTVAVSSSGKDVKKSINWRNKIKDFLANDNS
jgi:precorrin-2 dehydrogenase / sirohydrochlorin ferrochelatase